jgi:Protein kinase domain
MLAPNETIGDGRYRLLRKLGAGGMASVWLARDHRLDRDVAVKVIADSLADDPAWLTRFEREARAAAAVSHPNVVSIFETRPDIVAPTAPLNAQLPRRRRRPCGGRALALLPSRHRRAL